MDETTLSDGGSGTSRHSTKRRRFGFARLSQYIHSRGVSLEHEDEEVRPKIDLELFCKAMENKRGWDLRRAVQEWGAAQS